MPGGGHDGPTKRPAPISASAFSFSLSKKPRPPPIVPPATAPRTPHSASTALTVPPAHLTGGLPISPGPTPTRVRKSIPAPPAQNGTPLRSILDIRTPHRPFSPANDANLNDEDVKAFPSVRSDAQETPRRVSIIKPLHAFTTPDPKKTESSALFSARKLNSTAFQHQLTPRVDSELDERPKKLLGAIALPERGVADDILTRRKNAIVEEDEGIGVSPRGKRIMKWAGKGMQPPSVRLANLLSSANASLQLFHTAMHHALYPSQRSRLTPIRPQHKTSSTNSVEGITPFQHAQSAPLRLRLESALPGPTHHSVFFWCEILASQPSFDSSPTRVLIAFPPVPAGSPRPGVDPRLLSIKMADEVKKRWQVGVWAWSKMSIPLQACGSDEEASDQEGYQDESRTTTALLASRYLVVEESESPSRNVE